MNWFLLLLAAAVVVLAVNRFLLAPRGLAPEQAKEALQNGTGVLVDVREPAEWSTGVAQGSALLPLSDLRGERAQWRAFLAEHKNKRLLLYCASGLRSGMAARQLRREGFDAANTGSLRSWAAAGWPVQRP